MKGVEAAKSGDGRENEVHVVKIENNASVKVSDGSH